MTKINLSENRNESGCGSGSVNAIKISTNHFQTTLVFGFIICTSYKTKLLKNAHPNAQQAVRLIHRNLYISDRSIVIKVAEAETETDVEERVELPQLHK